MARKFRIDFYLFTGIFMLFVWTNGEDQGMDPGGTAPGASPPAASERSADLLGSADRLTADDDALVTSPSTTEVYTDTTEEPDYISQCPSNIECAVLGGECIDCDYENVTGCVYGKPTEVICTPKVGVECSGPSEFTRSLTCRYCYQTPESEHYCTPPVTADSQCRVVSAPRERYRANCTAHSDVLCLGRRSFYKMKVCDWTSGKRWSTALILSITVGGFGVDRFYLGLWKEGIGKLFSFGGLGAWTLVDVVLIATGYVGPADGSLYIF